MKKQLSFLMSLSGILCCALFLLHCAPQEVKLTRDDRYHIDTLSASRIVAIGEEFNKWCTDSSPVFRQRYVDSLVIVQEQEILQQMSASNK